MKPLAAKKAAPEDFHLSDAATQMMIHHKERPKKGESINQYSSKYKPNRCFVEHL
ncbi:MAG: hypothetical protein LBH80_08015 [Prevotellaceae bacterium]|jgi:hypothetical protein|nr:hypothetical protein [Prevotellaceae bacterium]